MTARLNILLLGQGAREHALAWKLKQSPLLGNLYAARGNPGLAALAPCVALNLKDHAAVIAFARDKRIDLVVVGPEEPLVAGIVDDLEAAGIKALGPGKAAAQLEGSKAFVKELCRQHDIPTASYEIFTDGAAARAYARAQNRALVIKADGLAAGKGVFMCRDTREALAAIETCFTGKLGAAGERIVIEEWLSGEEASFFVLADGVSAVALGTAQDHKRAFDGDQGPNTGGMGAYSPSPRVTPAVADEVMARIIMPTLAAMAARGTPYRGILYAGLMLTAQGAKLIEYNVRFGDPEAQVILPRLKSDLLAALVATRQGRLGDVTLEWSNEAAITVVLAAKGYPQAPERGAEIHGIAAAGAIQGVQIFHAGTRSDGARLLADGGRVLSVTATGATLQIARDRAYQALSHIDMPGGFYRRDIGFRALTS